jgi:hypothetical protein
VYQQSQTTGNCPTSHGIETGTVYHRHLEKDFLNIFATAADIQGSVNKIYNHTNLMATTYSNECRKKLPVEHNYFYLRVKAKQGNVVPVQAMKAYTGKYSSTYFNLSARWMCSTSHP